MTPQQRRDAILEALKDGGLDQFQIAATIADAPFQVRAELKAMRRDRLVRDRLTPRAHIWELTEFGARVVWEVRQLQIGGSRS